MKKPSKLSQQLEAAANLLQTQGWCQGREKDRKGRYCVYGACTAVAVEDWIRVNYWFHAKKGQGAVSWNDRPGASKIRVIQALRACAKDLA